MINLNYEAIIEELNADVARLEDERYTLLDDINALEIENDELLNEIAHLEAQLDYFYTESEQSEASRMRGALEDILTADSTTTWDSLLAVAKHGLGRN